MELLFDNRNAASTEVGFHAGPGNKVQKKHNTSYMRL